MANLRAGMVGIGSMGKNHVRNLRAIDGVDLVAIADASGKDPFGVAGDLPILPDVDAVIETVGAATWSHSVKSLRPGGALVISGATSGDRPAHAELTRIFFLELKVVGSTMGSKDELEDLLAFCATTGVRPVIDEVLPLDRAREGFQRLESGDLFGKIVLTPTS